MNTEALQTYVKLAEVKNFTQTANQLFVAQSTVTNRISDLEAELGFKLIVRERKQFSLTHEGEHFLEYAQRILNLENTAIRELSNLGHYSRSLKIGCTNTIYDCHIATPLVDFFNTHSEISLSFVIDHSLPLIQMLLDNTIDAAFTYVPYEKDNIKCVRLAADSMVLVTAAWNSKYSYGINRDDLISIPYYYCDFTFHDMGSFIKGLFPKNYPFPLSTDRSANLLPFILNGNGYTFLPLSLVRKYLDNGSLIQIPLLDFDVPAVDSYFEYKNENEELTELLHPLFP